MMRRRALAVAISAIPVACTGQAQISAPTASEAVTSSVPPQTPASTAVVESLPADGGGPESPPSTPAGGQGPTTTALEVTVTTPPEAPAVEAFYVWPEEDESIGPAGACGGDLPPCWVLQRESGGDVRVWNGGCYDGPCPGGSTASGKWQFIRSTWAGYGGYRDAADAPEHVQDAKAREVWAGGRGCSHWSAC